jgi:hypothetical protein
VFQIKLVFKDGQKMWLECKDKKEMRQRVSAASRSGQYKSVYGITIPPSR